MYPYELVQLFALRGFMVKHLIHLSQRCLFPTVLWFLFPPIVLTLRTFPWWLNRSRSCRPAVPAPLALARVYLFPVL